MKHIGFGLSFLLLTMSSSVGALAAVAIPLTVNLSETVTVTGAPQISVDVGGVTRVATYTSGTGTNALTFTLSPQAGDVDLDGIAILSPIDLNGGTIKDNKGNDATLTFTPPNTANVKVNYPSLGIDFVYDADGRYTLNGTVYNDLSSFLTATGGSFTRASVGTYFDSSGMLQTAASGVPRFDYDPVTHAQKGILIEESRTNYLTYSGQLTNAAWVTISTTKSGGFSTVDGTNNAIKVIEDTSNSTHHIKQNYTQPDNTVLTLSVFAKAAGRQYLALQGKKNDGSTYPVGIFNLASGGVSTTANGVILATSTPIGNGWYRCSITFNTGTGGGAGIAFIITHNGVTGTYTGDGTSGLYVWGAQLELGPFSTSYIPTTASSVIRQNDVLSVPAGTWVNNNEGTLWGRAAAYNAIAALNSSASPTLASLNTASFNIARLGRYATTPSTGLFQSGSGVSLLNLGTWANGATEKVAGTYKATGYSAVMGANPLSSQGASALSGSATQLHVGQFSNAGFWSSTIAAIKYYPQKVSNTQLQLLTQ